MDEHKYTILIVDDEYFLAKACERTLKQKGYETKISDSPLEALKEMDGHSIDVVISDCNMPEMDGIEFLKRMKESYPNAIRILMSATIDKIPKSAIEELNLYGLLEKPFGNDELLKMVKEAIEISSLFPQ